MKEGWIPKQDLLDELNELLNVPQVERIMYHKILELKTFLHDEIQRYQELREQFKRSAYGDMEVIEVADAAGGRPATYHFQLDLHYQNQWKATLVAPSPPPGKETYDILPDELVEYISSFKTEPQTITKQEKLTLPALKGRVFNLQFIKYSDIFIMGNITTYLETSEEEARKKKTTDLTEIYNYDKRDTDEGSYKELIYYMKKYPALNRYFLTELHMKMKPLIIGKLVNVTARSQPVDLF